MKILLVSPFDLRYPGGVNEHVLQLDRQFRSMGHDTRMLAPRSSDEDEHDDGHLYKLGMALPVPANSSTARVSLSPFVSNKVKQFLRREEFDVIHVHEPLTPTLPLLVLLHSKTANVGTFHASRTSHMGFNLGYLYGKPILSYFFERLHQRTAVSPVVTRFISQYFPASYQIVPNGINVDDFGPHVEPIERFPDDRPNVLFVGRFNESRKGLKYLIRAMALVRQEFPGCRLTVVGPGNPRRFDRLIAHHALDNVVFVGAVPKRILPAYYAACDVFCAPSTGRESFGIVLLEAMASGKPVVATNIAGYAGVVRHGVEGLLVERENPPALAMAIVHLLADSGLRERLGRAGLARAQSFAWPVVAQQYVEIYERARERFRRLTVPTPAASSFFSHTRSD